MAGAPTGNQNAASGKMWRAAICRAVEKRGVERGQALDEIAEKLLALCDAGEIQAIKELGDRLDGKPAQVLAGDPDAPLQTRLVIGG